MQVAKAYFIRLLGRLSIVGLSLVPGLLASLAAAESTADNSSSVQFVFTSDVHYGILRGKFRGQAAVDARIVNAALVERINDLRDASFAADSGLRSGGKIGALDFIAIGGDIANREEVLPIKIQSAAESWNQFSEDYLHKLRVKNRAGNDSPVLPVPGNHDVSNAIGSPTRMNPLTDASSLAGIYNLVIHPAIPLTKETYQYSRDRINYSRDFAGLHCIFVTIWPDTATRAWIEADLKAVSPKTPVAIFCHDPPDVDPKHLVNPNGRHDINSQDRFENLLSDQSADGPTTDSPSLLEQRAFVAFLKAHPNITAYFHGHSNWNEFYTWKGPDEDISLHVSAPIRR